MLIATGKGGDLAGQRWACRQQMAATFHRPGTSHLQRSASAVIAISGSDGRVRCGSVRTARSKGDDETHGRNRGHRFES